LSPTQDSSVPVFFSVSYMYLSFMVSNSWPCSWYLRTRLSMIGERSNAIVMYVRICHEISQMRCGRTICGYSGWLNDMDHVPVFVWSSCWFIGQNGCMLSLLWMLFSRKHEQTNEHYFQCCCCWYYYYYYYYYYYHHHHHHHHHPWYYLLFA